MITVPFPKRLRIACFACFALLLVVSTHWPQLRIEGPFPRPDLVMHLVAFGMWAFLLCVSDLLGEAGKMSNAVRCFGIGLVYGAIDESTQMIPVLGRFASLDDYAFNVIGLAIGCGLGLLVRTHPEPKPLAR